MHYKSRFFACFWSILVKWKTLQMLLELYRRRNGRKAEKFERMGGRRTDDDADNTDNANTC
jgi:hypothetical protein